MSSQGGLLSARSKNVVNLVKYFQIPVFGPYFLQVQLVCRDGIYVPFVCLYYTFRGVFIQKTQKTCGLLVICAGLE